MQKSKIIGRVNPLLKARIDNIQYYIDKMIFEYNMSEKYSDIIDEVLKVLFERKNRLVNQIKCPVD